MSPEPGRPPWQQNRPSWKEARPRVRRTLPAPAPRAALRIIFQGFCGLFSSLFPQSAGWLWLPGQGRRRNFGRSSRALPATRPLPARQPLRGVPEPRAGKREGPREGRGGARLALLIGRAWCGRSLGRGWAGPAPSPAPLIGWGGAESRQAGRGRSLVGAGRGGTSADAAHWHRRGPQPRPPSSVAFVSG